MTDGKLKLNLGSGVHTLSEEGWINVDKYEKADNILSFDLETFPWPWETSSVDTIIANHSLEHMGQDPNIFLKIMQEIYRVCCNDAVIYVNVPHPRHNEFLGDPTHVRPILADTFVLFSKAANKVFREKNGANSCFGFLLDVDFEVTKNQVVLDERFAYLKDDPNWSRFCDLNNNAIKEIRIELKVIKPDAT